MASHPRSEATGWSALGAVVVVAVLYGVGAVFFFVQERWALSPSRAEARSLAELHHPEAVLGILRKHSDGVYPNELRPTLPRVLELAPSFYQGPLYYADFLAQRREEPRQVRVLFEIAVRRFPANGRLHLAYAEWLLVARTDLSAITVFDGTDPLSHAESHMRNALALEPELSPRALAMLSLHRIAPERWKSVMPQYTGAERALVLALRQDGHREQALETLRALVASTTQVEELIEAASWALDWEAPRLAIEAARRVSSHAPSTALVRVTLLIARAHWALGEPDAAYESFKDALHIIESRVGVEGTARLDLLCAAGDQYLRRGELLLAESFYAEAVLRHDAFVPAALGLARIYRRRNELQAAIEQYEKVLRLDVENDSARRELEELQHTR